MPLGATTCRKCGVDFFWSGTWTDLCPSCTPRVELTLRHVPTPSTVQRIARFRWASRLRWWAWRLENDGSLHGRRGREYCNP